MDSDLHVGAAALSAALAKALAAGGSPELWPGPEGPPQALAAEDLPVLRWLASAAAAAPPAAAAALAALAALAPRLAWRQTYTRDEAEPAFLDNYGWTELVGAQGLYPDPAVSAGILVLGPGTFYPPHSHPAREDYVPLSGAADWYDEDLGWRRLAPLSRVRHRPGVAHAMRTAEAPLVAYYLWSGAGVAARARLAPPPA